MNSFLRQIGEIYHRIEADEKCFIFPTQRAVSLFKSELYLLNNSSLELPLIYTWSAFVEEITPVKVIDKKLALTLLFQAYNNKFNATETFVQFLNWGDIVFDDFERVVLQNLDGKKVLNQVNIIKVMERWELDVSTKKNYLSIWKILPSLFTEFYQLLEKKKLVTNAKKYELASAELLKRNSKKISYFFCGFTVFSEAEKKMINGLNNENNVVVIQDSPIWGNITEKHESNKFINDMKPFCSSVINIDDKKITPKKIESINCGNELIATKVVSDLLLNLSKQEIDNTAIVLLNDNDLPLLLNSIPNEIDRVNIGIGKTFVNTPEGFLFQSLVSIYKSFKKKGEVSFLDIFEFLDTLKPLKILNISQIEKLRDGILRKNLKALNQLQFAGIFSNTELKCFSVLMKKKIDLKTFVKSFLDIKILAWKNGHLVFQNVLSYFNVLNNGQANDDLFLYFLENEMKSVSLSIQGEKNKGLQIMSLLETRCLDYENLIFLSFLDENLPQSTITTYIPLELQIQYRFADQGARESVFAYHFMRLLKRAKNAKFIFSGNSSFSKAGDPSRFLLQAKMEWSKRDDNLEFKSTVIKNEIEPFVQNELTIDKSDKVYDAIKYYLFERGLSPSALNVYLSNPMDFLLYHVLQLREKENVDLAVETSTLGTVIHDTLEEMYKPYLGSTSSTIDVKSIFNRLQNQIIIELTKVYPKAYLESGRLKILLPVIEQWIKNFLWIDKKRGDEAPFTIIELEQKLEYVIPKTNFPLKMKGIVDRLESWKNCEHVVDYKTGKVIQKDLKLTSADLLTFDSEKSKAYQLLMYTHIYKGTNPSSKSVRSSIYSFRNQKSGFLPLFINDQEIIEKKEMLEFEEGIVKVAKSMLDRETPIKLTNHRYQKFSV